MDISNQTKCENECSKSSITKIGSVLKHIWQSLQYFNENKTSHHMMYTLTPKPKPANPEIYWGKESLNWLIWKNVLVLSTSWRCPDSLV